MVVEEAPLVLVKPSCYSIMLYSSVTAAAAADEVYGCGDAMRSYE